MIEWWEALSSAHKVFWFIAIVFSVLFFIQFILLLIGMDSDTDLDEGGSDVSFQSDFSALSVRSIIAFFTFFGWTGVLMLNNALSVWLAVVLASIAGMAAMFIVAYMIWKLSQLEQSGTLNLVNALDKLGEVYLPIPGKEKGTGKIHLNVDGRIREMDAVTSGEDIRTGASVKVIDILEGNVLKVVPEEKNMLHRSTHPFQ